MKENLALTIAEKDDRAASSEFSMSPQDPSSIGVAVSGEEMLDRLPPDQQDALSRILESYLADLENGIRQDPQELIESYPELAEPLRWYLGSLEFLHEATADLGATETDRPLAEQTLHELGDYQIVREIGRGGMGIVYEARQKSLDRKVALKVLPFAAVLDQRQIIRFKNEAHSAAQLHHPNIVPVHSVGCDRGVHYYSMQLIEGQSLDQAIHQLQALETSEIVPPNAETEAVVTFSTQRSVRSASHVRSVVELIRQAASALQHAHEFGVVHRDIKPSNLLVDQQSKLWITDFGLARCQTSTTITMTGDLVGTIRYMSPEAAAGRGHLVDQLSDVYSLGVSLYELLTLKTPHPANERAALLHQVLNDEPIPPRRHNGSIPVDLETIILKAIEKRRDDRYESAAAFGEDLRRFLSGQSPVATRPTAMDRLGKWASRHRMIVAAVAGGLLLTTLATGMAATLISNEKAKTDAALLIAESNFNQSQSNLNKAIEVVDRFGMRLAGKLSGVPGAEELRRTILTETLADYQQFADQMQGDESMRFALALCHTQMASMLRGLGQFPESMQRYAEAVELYEHLLGDTNASAISNRTRVRQDLAICHNNWGELSFQQGNVPTAESHYRKGLGIAEKLLEEDPDNETSRHLMTAILVNDGNLKRSTGRSTAAKEIYERAVVIQRSLCDEMPENQMYARELAVSYAQLSFLLANDDLDQATQFNQQAILVHQRLVDQNPNDVAALSELATCYNHRGSIYRQRDRLDDARAAYEEAVEVQERLVARAPTVVRYQEQLAVGHNNLGQILMAESGLSPAEDHTERVAEHFERARQMLARLVVIAPQSPHFRAQLGGVLANLAPLLAPSKPELANGYYDAAIEHQEWALSRSPKISDFRTWLDSSYLKYGKFLRDRQEFERAGELAIRRRELWRGHPMRLYRVARDFAELANLDVSQRDDWMSETEQTLTQATDAGLTGVSEKMKDPVFALIEEQSKLQPVNKR